MSINNNIESINGINILKNFQAEEMIMVKFKCLCLCIFLLVFVFGCSYPHLTPSGTMITSSPNIKTDNCEYLNEVVGKGGGAGGGFVLNEKLLAYALIDLKNKAAALGATHIKQSTPSYGTGEGTTTSVMITGSAYKCP
jgi:Domain of unknown function (DUF4156)